MHEFQNVENKEKIGRVNFKNNIYIFSKYTRMAAKPLHDKYETKMKRKQFFCISVITKHKELFVPIMTAEDLEVVPILQTLSWRLHLKQYATTSRGPAGGLRGEI